MTVTVAQFLSEFPQFESTSNGAISAALTTAALQVGPVWGDLQDRATSLLAAHSLAVMASAAQTGGRPTGNLTGVNVPGEVSLQYAQAATSDQSGLSSTVYGQEYLSLQKFVIVPIRIY